MATPKPLRFAAKLRELRERAGITQAQLAQRAGLHLSAVTRFEQGLREPSLATAADLAAALGVSVNDFLAAPTQDAAPKSRGRPRKAAPATPATPPAEELLAEAQAPKPPAVGNKEAKKPCGRPRKGK